jgi:hypothetical protein
MAREGGGGKSERAREREGERGEGGPYSRSRNITKVSAASQFARSKRALVSGPGTRKKASSPFGGEGGGGGANKNHLHLPAPSHPLSTRLYAGGEDERLKGRKSRALFVQQRASKVPGETKGRLYGVGPSGPCAKRMFYMYRDY